MLLLLHTLAGGFHLFKKQTTYCKNVVNIVVLMNMLMKEREVRNRQRERGRQTEPFPRLIISTRKCGVSVIIIKISGI